jgi:hypothetical protein
MLWKTKATLSGDVLGDVWGRSRGSTRRRRHRGLLAEVPFRVTADPAQLLGAMASVAIDLA